MRYKSETGPYEHTCPSCGRHQEVYEYDQDPSFDVGEIREFRDGDDPGIKCQMIVDPNRKFKCIACGYTQYFKDGFVDTGVEGSMVLHNDGAIEINTAVRKIKRKFRKENEPEDYL